MDCELFTKINLNTWTELTKLGLTKSDLTKINSKLNEIISKTPFKKKELIEICIPLLSILNYKIKNKRKLSKKYKTFIIGFNGSVSSGKSTFAELFEYLFKLLYKRVKLISTDSFIYPNTIYIATYFLGGRLPNAGMSLGI